MPSYFGYTFAIFGTQSKTAEGSVIDYRFAPSGTWSYSGTDTYFVVEERRSRDTNFDGDPTNETIARNLQIGRNRAQTTEIDGTDRQVIWDYTFEVTDGMTVWRVGVVDVDLDNSNQIEAGAENGYFLVFPDGMQPPDKVLNTCGIVENDDATSHADLGATVVCFAAGTLIETDRGPRPVETLIPGDLVLTRDAGLQPLVWAGATQVHATGSAAPIVISPGTFGNTDALIVSPQHGVLLDDWRAELLCGSADVLVRAVDLLNHDGVYRRTEGEITYCHILLDAHQLVMASGIWSESLYPGAMTRQTVNPIARAEIEALFPDITQYGPMAAPCLRGFEAACLTS